MLWCFRYRLCQLSCHTLPTQLQATIEMLKPKKASHEILMHLHLRQKEKKNKTVTTPFVSRHHFEFLHTHSVAKIVIPM